MVNKTMIILAVLFTVGCNKEEAVETTDNSDGIVLEIPGTAMVSDYDGYREEKGYTESNIKKTVEIYLDKLSFGEAFKLQRRVKGEGRTFWWRSNEYTTDFLEVEK